MLYAGAGTYNGYATQPSIAKIIEKGYDYCDLLVLVSGNVYHNGINEYPVVGDNIKWLIDSDYSGGASSLPYDFDVNDFGAFALADNDTLINGQGRIFKYLIFRVSTAEIVDVIDCA